MLVIAGWVDPSRVRIVGLDNADCGLSVARIAWIGVAAGASGWLVLDLEEAEIGARRRRTG